MKKKIINIMFLGCFASPALLFILSGKVVFFSNASNDSKAAAVLILYLPIIALLSGFADIKMDSGTILCYTYGIVTFCVGVFLAFSLSWWYILVSVYAFIFLFLLYSENDATR